MSHEYRIYLDDRAQLYAVVDENDWHHFSRWLWTPKISRGGWKCYARRSQPNSGGGSIYLHIEIMKLIEPPPTVFHTIADHLNGDSLNCKQKNLRWATPRMNRLNIRGASHRDMQQALL